MFSNRTVDSNFYVQAEAKNKVLKNTYWLLALSMLPTILGAWLGLQMNFDLFATNPFLSVALFFGISFFFFYAIERNKHSSTGVFLLLGFTFFMGLMLSRILGLVLGLQNGASFIFLAFSCTALIFFVMASFASVVKREISGFGQWLFAGAVLLMIASLLNLWLQIPALMLTLLVLTVLIFSGFIFYDLKRIIDGGETNYITATLSIYLSIYNIFQSLLSLFSIFGGSSRD